MLSLLPPLSCPQQNGPQLSSFAGKILGGCLLMCISANLNAQAPALPPAFTKPLFVKQIPFKCTGLAFEPVSRKIYVSLPSSFGPEGNSIAALDPATGLLVNDICRFGAVRYDRVG